MGEEKFKSQKKKKISMGDEKCKSQEKKNKEKKRMKFESSLEYCGKRKRWYKVV